MSEISAMLAPDTSPEKAIPLPIPTPPPPPSIDTLRHWLPLYLHTFDQKINHLSRILSSPSTTDKLLLTLCYTSLLSSSLLSSISTHTLRNQARLIISKAISLPPSTTLVISTSSFSPPPRLAILSRRLKALSSLISDFRIFTRLWGLLGIWKWGKSLLETPNPDLLVKNIGYAQVVVNIFYQYLENGAYLSSKGVLGWSKEKQGKAWVWSSRFWMAHVGLDLLRLGHELRKRRRRVEEVERTGGVVDEQVERGIREKWRRELVVNLAYAPLTVHWSLEKGLVNEFWVGLLGSVAGITGFREAWKITR